MSWTEHINTLLESKLITEAAIFGLDGTVWAKSDGLECTPKEITDLIEGFRKQEMLTNAGVKLSGQKYIYLSGTDRIIRARHGNNGVHCIKTASAVVVGYYESPVLPQQAANIIEQLGDYLTERGY